MLLLLLLLLLQAMGSTTGHTTTALWVDGELFIVESDIQSAFWPMDNIQRTPYEQWLKQAHAADYQVAWAPLSLKYRKMYNETAAYEYFQSVEGYEYGFKTLLWGWLDTLTDNFPCLPPDYSSNCLQWALLEPALALVDRRIPEIGDMIWNAGLNQRLGTTNLRTADLFYEASQRGISSNELITIVERDEWVYNTTRNDQPAVGPAMVCCVFVCNMVCSFSYWFYILLWTYICCY